MAKIKIEDIRQEAKEHSWNILTEEYQNLDLTMEWECSEGHTILLPYKSVRGKYECPVCKQNIYKNKEFKVVSKDKKYRILALDQATKVTGWAVYDDQDLVAYGIFTAKEQDPIARDNTIRNWLISMIYTWQPDLIGLEGIQLQENNVTLYTTLARLQGVLMQTCYELNKEYEICHTAVWRKHCGVKGTSRADKKISMQRQAKAWFDVTLTDDISDAIGIGKYLVDTRAKYQIIKWT